MSKHKLPHKNYINWQNYDFNKQSTFPLVPKAHGNFLSNYHFRVAIESRQVEGRTSILVCMVGGSSTLHQAADNR